MFLGEKSLFSPLITRYIFLLVISAIVYFLKPSDTLEGDLYFSVRVKSLSFLCRHMTLPMESQTCSNGSEQSLVPTIFIVANMAPLDIPQHQLKTKANHHYHHHYHQGSRITLFFDRQVGFIGGHE